MGYNVLQIQGAAQSGHMSEIWRKQEGQGALVGYDQGVQKIKNKNPSEVGPLSNPLEEPNGCLGRRIGAH